MTEDELNRRLRELVGEAVKGMTEAKAEAAAVDALARRVDEGANLVLETASEAEAQKISESIRDILKKEQPTSATVIVALLFILTDAANVSPNFGYVHSIIGELWNRVMEARLKELLKARAHEDLKEEILAAFKKKMH